MKHLLSLFAKIETPKMRKRLRKLIVKRLVQEVQDVGREFDMEMNLVVNYEDSGSVVQSFTHESVSL